MTALEAVTGPFTHSDAPSTECLYLKAAVIRYRSIRGELEVRRLKVRSIAISKARNGGSKGCRRVAIDAGRDGARKVGNQVAVGTVVNAQGGRG
jgi:hypothetical protein